MILCENLVPLVEAVNDFVGHVGKQVRLTKSSAEGPARDVKNFRGTSFSFGSFSFGRAKENEHQSLPQLATEFFIDHFYGKSWFGVSTQPIWLQPHQNSCLMQGV
jgi:hypothetical protein